MIDDKIFDDIDRVKTNLTLEESLIVWDPNRRRARGLLSWTVAQKALSKASRGSAL
jgi:hypothetical protein